MPSGTKDTPVELTTPLEPGLLKFLSMTATEELGRPFEFGLEMWSGAPTIKAEDLLGQPITVKLTAKNDATRFFHGHVAEFSCPETAERAAKYRVVLRPKLWFLSQTSDCRIFQGLKVPEILKLVFDKHGLSDIEMRLSGDYRTWEYCVQYRETDFDFASRMMEQEGIYYYFRHEEGRHVLVLADSISAHDTVPEYETIRTLNEATTSPREDHITSWIPVQKVRPGAYVLGDFDFKNPRPIVAQVKDPKLHAEADHEVFDYPGEYLTTSEGEASAKVRLEELHASHQVSHGESYARGLMAGALFTLTDHAIESQNDEYLITHASHEVRQDKYEPGSGTAEITYTGRLTAIFSKQPFRSARITPKPTVPGPQTAIVVGGGDAVYTDEYGRVKVQFHWDRHGGSDENSSCWVRVAQLWAGKNWGGMHIPEVGQEVIVEFLEGDPDRPIITGRVYNEDNMPPLPLPANNYKSIIRDHYGNQLIFDATPGNEHIQLFSPHWNSMLELGKSVTWKSEDPAYFTSAKDYFSVVMGVSASVSVGAKGGLVIGADMTITIGGTFGLLLGGKLEAAKGSNYTYFSGNKFEYAGGVKISHSAAEELRVADAGFGFRTKKAIVLDSNEKATINAGSKDNSLINMDDNEILIDYGTDAAVSNRGAESDAASHARDAIYKSVLAWGAGGAALGATGAALAATVYQTTGDAVAETDVSFWDTLLGPAGIGVVGGALALKYALAKKSDQSFADVYKADIGGSKVAQEKTFSRIRLAKDGIRIQTFESGKLAKESDTAEIFISNKGDIEITSEKKGIVLFAKEEITIKATKDVKIISDADVKITAKNISLKAKGGKVTADPKIENAGG